MIEFPGGTITKDHEGVRLILLCSNGDRTWEPLEGSYQVYEILDNGDHPFEVVVCSNKIFILNTETHEHVMTIKDYSQAIDETKSALTWFWMLLGEKT